MIALDMMGGDHAPEVVVLAALNAARKSIPVLLCGHKDTAIRLLEKYDSNWKDYSLSIKHASDFVEMDDDPVASVRKKIDSSLVQSVASVKDGVAQAVVSAGNSGAFLVAATLLLGRNDGVDRPAIAGFLPTKKGKVLCLDLGANTEVRPQHLYQFAHMGACYFEQVLGKKSPRVALLANGHEEGKGSAVTKEAHALLKNSKLNFVGNVEPYHVLEHEVDVVVCDGFSGNILLKTCEAVIEATVEWFEHGIRKSVIDNNLSEKIIFDVKESIDSLLDYKRVGGALLLGVNGIVVVCHGGSDVIAIERAIEFAWENLKNNYMKIKEHCSSVQL